MALPPVNLTGVIVAAVVAFILGPIYYSQGFFGKKMDEAIWNYTCYG